MYAVDEVSQKLIIKFHVAFNGIFVDRVFMLQNRAQGGEAVHAAHWLPPTSQHWPAVAIPDPDQQV